MTILIRECAPPLPRTSTPAGAESREVGLRIGARFHDDATGASYFTAEVVVPRAALDGVSRHLGHGQLRPGLPVEVVITVRKRTALDYLLEPLIANFWRALREQ